MVDRSAVDERVVGKARSATGWLVCDGDHEAWLHFKEQDDGVTIHVPNKGVVNGCAGCGKSHDHDNVVFVAEGNEADLWKLEKRDMKWAVRHVETGLLWTVRDGGTLMELDAEGPRRQDQEFFIEFDESDGWHSESAEEEGGRHKPVESKTEQLEYVKAEKRDNVVELFPFKMLVPLCEIHNGRPLLIKHRSGKYLTKVHKGAKGIAFQNPVFLTEKADKHSLWIITRPSFYTESEPCVGIRAASGRYLARFENCALGPSPRDVVFCEVVDPDATPAARFLPVYAGEGFVAFVADNGNFLTPGTGCLIDPKFPESISATMKREEGDRTPEEAMFFLEIPKEEVVQEAKKEHGEGVQTTEQNRLSDSVTDKLEQVKKQKEDKLKKKPEKAAKADDSKIGLDAVPKAAGMEQHTNAELDKFNNMSLEELQAELAHLSI